MTSTLIRAVARSIDEERIDTHFGTLSPSLPPDPDIDKDHEEDRKDEEAGDVGESIDWPP